MKRKQQLLGLLVITGLGIPSFANAQKKDSLKEKNIEETVIIGTRNKNRVLTDVPAPVDVFSVKDIIINSPQTNVNQILNYIAPSFTSNPTSTADGTDHVDPAQLRGLGTDQTLVLLNGKRRHTSSLVNINGSPGRGSVGTDLNAIPAFAVDRIEVLRDGSAAQYGSDAIAGVINVNLKRNKGFSGALQYGGNVSNASNNFSGGIDGQLLQLDLNYGTNLGKKGGFFNITGTVANRENTSRAGIRNNSIFNAYNAVERIAGNNGVNLSSLFGNITNTPNENQIINYVKQYGSQVDYFKNISKTLTVNGQNVTKSIYDWLQTSTTLTSGDTSLQKILNTDVTNNEIAARGLSRKDFNMNVGQSKLATGQVYYNAKLPLNEITSLYSFGGLSYRKGDSYAFYRLPNGSGTSTSLYSNGFLPEIESDIYDFSTALGLTSKLAGFDVDLSTNLGTNSFSYTINNTANATLGVNSPSSFNAGKIAFLQNTNNLDFSRNFDVLEGLNLAFGAEYRYENFQINKGEEASYTLYDINGNVATSGLDPKLAVTDFFGNRRGGGSQGFTGFQPLDEINKSRNSFAAYLDTEVNIFNNWIVSGALRYENYSDFGNTLNGKLATLVKITPTFNWRASAQTGFRAPSLQQKYFSSTSTQFFTNTSTGLLEPKQVTFFTNESEAADLVGIPRLKPEKSKSISTGFTFKIPSANLSIAVDGYFTRINDRVILTGAYSRPTIPAGTSAEVAAALTRLQNAFDKKGADRASFFSNGINTETKGVDVVITHKYDFGNGVSIKSDLAGSYNHTQRVGKLQLPQTLINSGSNAASYAFTFFPESSKVYLENAIPRFKASLSNNLSLGKLDILLRNSYFGKVTDPGATDVNLDGSSSVYEHPVYGGKLITDISVGYQYNKNLRFTVGANNVGDVYPDTNPTTVPAFTNTSPGLTSSPSTDLSNANQFVYSRAVSQYGLNGRYLFARINFNF